MSITDPYTRGLFTRDPYAASTPITGRLVTVLDGHLTGRGLQLIKPPSRALSRHDVHELILTDQPDAAPGAVVERVWYAGFFEVTQSGMAISGATVWVGDVELGILVGFDETHMPNHCNIIIRTDRPATGLELGLHLEDTVTIAGRSPKSPNGK